MLPALLRSPRPLLVVLAVAAPLALSACTGGQSASSSNLKGAKKDVQAVVKKLSDLADDRNASAICKDVFSAELAADFAKLGDGKCATPVDRAIRNADYTVLAVDSVELNGSDAAATSAVARIQVQKDGPKRGITLERTDAKAPWRIASFQPKLSSTKATTPASTTPATTPATTP